MAYRACPEFAVGHGTGVQVKTAGDDPMRAVQIATTAVPSHEIPFTGVPEPGTDRDLPWLDDVVLDMQWRRMTCQTSLRNVDQGIRLLLAREGDGVSIVDEPPFEAAPIVPNGDSGTGGAGAR
jgi:hypothetical protein